MKVISHKKEHYAHFGHFKNVQFSNGDFQIEKKNQGFPSLLKNPINIIYFIYVMIRGLKINKYNVFIYFI